MTRLFISFLTTLILFSFLMFSSASATQLKRIVSPPLTEQWYGIYVDNERVGFYRQKISSATGGGYHIEADGSVKMKIMGFSKEASTRESYFVTKSLGLRTFEVEQTINNQPSRVVGTAKDNIIRLTIETNGTKKEKQIKVRGEVFPGAALNILPLIRDTAVGKTYKVMMFDPEELKVKDVKISILGEEMFAGGTLAIKLRNNLYPFVNNDVWVGAQGETLMESVRDGLVTTKLEPAKQLVGFIGNLALSKKDLIYDFSMIRVQKPLDEKQKKNGLILEIQGWNDALPLLQTNYQRLTPKEPGILGVRTGTEVVLSGVSVVTEKPADFLQPAEKIESNAPQLVAKVQELLNNKTIVKDRVIALAGWTSEWLKDTVDDAGGALESFSSRSGNCQTHARLYTALARAAGIPTRFVSGLVYQEKLGFLYHSWAESLVDGSWLPVDPTFNQIPADPTHIKLFEGHRPEDMTPIISIIGRIKINVLESQPNILPVTDNKPAT